MNNVKRLAAAALVVGLLAMPMSASAVGSSVGLGTADSYVVLAGQTVTNTGPTVLNGDLGLHPGSAVTGFPPGLVAGVQHVADAEALQAKSDLVIAYNNAAGQATDFANPPDIGGLTLVPGVYTSGSTLFLTGTVTLDALGDPNAVWIFQVGSALTTASSSTVAFINGAQPCNVFWQVGSSATLGTNTTFVGTIMALTSITVTTGATINGRALARNGSVTLDSNAITRSACYVAPPPPPPTPTPVVPTPTPVVPSATPVVPTPTATPAVTPPASSTPSGAPSTAPSTTPVITPPASTAPSGQPAASANPASSATPAGPNGPAAATAATTAAPAVPISNGPNAPATTPAETAPVPVVNGPNENVPFPTPNFTMPPTDTEPLAPGTGNSSTFGGLMVLLGGLMVLAAAGIVRKQPARR